MNVIGVFAPKIVSFFIIWLSPVCLENKAILTIIWLIKLIIDYDVAKPSHRGVVYKAVRKMEIESAELVVNCIQFMPAILFLIMVFTMGTEVLLIPGVIAVLVHIVLIISCIKDIKDKRKRKNGK